VPTAVGAVNIKLFHQWLEIAIVVITVFKMLSVFCVKQILTFGARFIPSLVREEICLWRIRRIQHILATRKVLLQVRVWIYECVETKVYYSKETLQREIKAHNRTGTVEQMDANIEAMARDLQEILRLSAEQKRLWEVYEGR